MRIVNEEVRRAKQIEMMEKCFDCYAENGFSSVGVKAIADACGCSVANLYQYFNNLDDLFREKSTLSLSGGTIKNNTADRSGGAVYFNTTSDGKIQGILNISGNPVVKDNTVSDKANNIYLKSGKTLSIVEAMTDGASVGITTKSTNYPIVFSNA